MRTTKEINIYKVKQPIHQNQFQLISINQEKEQVQIELIWQAQYKNQQFNISQQKNHLRFLEQIQLNEEDIYQNTKIERTSQQNHNHTFCQIPQQNFSIIQNQQACHTQISEKNIVSKQIKSQRQLLKQEQIYQQLKKQKQQSANQQYYHNQLNSKDKIQINNEINSQKLQTPRLGEIVHLKEIQKAGQNFNKIQSKKLQIDNIKYTKSHQQKAINGSVNSQKVNINKTDKKMTVLEEKISKGEISQETGKNNLSFALKSKDTKPKQLSIVKQTTSLNFGSSLASAVKMKQRAQLNIKNESNHLKRINSQEYSQISRLEKDLSDSRQFKISYHDKKIDRQTQRQINESRQDTRFYRYQKNIQSKTGNLKNESKNESEPKLPKISKDGKKKIQNYLPNPEILRKSSSLIQKNKQRIKKASVTSTNKLFNLQDKSLMKNMFIKGQKSLLLKGIEAHKVIQESQQNQRQQQIQIDNIIDKKFQEYYQKDNQQQLTQKSTKTGKKLFQIQFRAKKYQIPDDIVHTLNQSINIIKQCIIQPLDMDIDFTPPSPDMEVEQLLKKGEKMFKVLGFKRFNYQNYRGIKIIKFRNCIQFSIQNYPDQLIWHYNGKFYFGGWLEDEKGQGIKEGNGVEYVPEKYLYKGQFLKNKRNGTGTIQIPNGNLYEGQWLDGNKHGFGKFIDNYSGAFYQGQWINNKRQGYGFLRLSPKQYYVGTFVRSIKHGHGFQQFSNGDRYQGQYLQGKFHGKGRYIWADHSFYDGRFQGGHRYGFGCWRSSPKGGSMYLGEYLKDKKSGYGRFVSEDGEIFEGQYLNDLRNGTGRFIDRYGIQKRGRWKDDKLIEVDGQYSKFNLQQRQSYNLNPQSHQFPSH